MIKRLLTKKKIAAGLAIGMAVAGVGVAAGATYNRVVTSGSGGGRAVMTCPGGMTRLGHALDEGTSVFPFDPAIHITNTYDVVPDGFRVEDIDFGSHTGTHIDAPSHFYGEDGRSLDELAAEEFVWPAYKIDVRGMALDNNQLSVDDIRDYERDNGRIKRGSLVIIQTGAEEFFGLDGAGDMYKTDDNGTEGDEIDDLAINVDDLFAFDNAGFSGDAVQWLFDNRSIDGVGSDAYGPDAANDAGFSATDTALANDGIALVALANLDSMTVRGDVVFASAVSLTDGSGFSTDPIACHGRK